ncbi:hypothetical protein Pelo_19196 [Pelomyxa schiedti]|nr:hypothetical protein Pelo_19196 [Pelomyxa schiedti]
MLRPNTINACCSRVSRNTSGYVICIPDKSGGIVLAEEGPPAYFGSWASFVQRLPADQCVLAVANFFYKQAFDDPPHHIGEIVSKKISVLWSPTAAHSLKDKFVLCSTRESFLRNMFGSDSPIQMQASEPEQLGFEEVLDKLHHPEQIGPTPFQEKPKKAKHFLPNVYGWRRCGLVAAAALEEAAGGVFLRRDGTPRGVAYVRARHYVGGEATRRRGSRAGGVRVRDDDSDYQEGRRLHGYGWRKRERSCRAFP